MNKLKEQYRLSTATVTLRRNPENFPQILYKKMEEMNHNFSTFIRQKLTDLLIENGYQVQQWNAINLWIRDSSRDGIMRSIQDISFPYLKQLRLPQNNIESVEILRSIDAPNLQYLYLRSNNINTISSLRKMQSDSIREIRLWNNMIKEADSLTQGNWPNMFHIGIEYYSMNQCQCLAFCAKMEHRSDQPKYQLNIICLERLDEMILLSRLLQKYAKRQVDIWKKDGRLRQ